jgi:methyl-accepting chemotaxis protein
MKLNQLNIATKIWLPFSAFLLLIFGAIVFYYPKKQREVFEGKKNTEMTELAKTVALGVELSLNNDDFLGLRKTLDFVENRTDFEYVAIVLDEFDSSEVYLSYPESTDRNRILNPNSEELLIQDESFQTDGFNGFIRLGVSKRQINEQIKLLNFPVYVILFVGLITSLLLFFFLAKFISKPIGFVTQIAGQLENGNYEVEILNAEGKNEVAFLNQALISLRDKLKEERQINDTLTSELEDKVETRTSELKKVAQKLRQAQRVSGIGSFSFNFKTKQ